MNQIKNLLEERVNQLQQLKQEKEKALTKVPEGGLRICKHGSRVQFYHRSVPGDFNGVYIKEKDIELAKQLAQKDYDKKVLSSVEQELHALKKYESCCPKKSAEEIYESLHVERQKIITPIMETDAEYIQKWEQESYYGKEFQKETPEFYTSKGERVRSKSEIIIADMLSKEGIPYRYEYPIYLRGVGRIYPDFTVLRVQTRQEVFWEHLGMMDDPVYLENAIKKIVAYEQNGIFPGDNLLLTYETKKNVINQRLIKSMIEHYLK